MTSSFSSRIASATRSAPSSLNGFRSENGVVSHQVAVLVILVPTAVPVRHDDVELLFANRIRDAQRALLVERNLAVRIRHENAGGAQQLCRAVHRLALHFTVPRDCDALRRTPLSQRQAQENTMPTALHLACHSRPHGKHAIPGMRSYRHDFARHNASKPGSLTA